MKVLVMAVLRRGRARSMIGQAQLGHSTRGTPGSQRLEAARDFQRLCKSTPLSQRCGEELAQGLELLSSAGG